MSDSNSPVNLATTILAGLVSGYIAFRTTELSGPAPALLALITASWLFYHFTSLGKIWGILSMLINPAKTTIVAFSVAVTYFAVQGFLVPELLLTGVGFSLIGSALAIILYNYWMIGG